MILKRHLFQISGGPFFLVPLYFSVAVFAIFCGAPNIDEGFYALGTRAVAAGYFPYQDFGFTQTPLVLYVNSLVMRFLGYGLFEQRCTNALWCVLAVGLGTVWLFRRVGGLSASLYIGILSISLEWMYWVHLGKTYALTALLAIMATILSLELVPSRKKSAVLAAVCVVGIASRLPSAPFFVILWMSSLATDRHQIPGLVGASLVSFFASTSVIFGPFIFWNPEKFWFWTVHFHQISVPNRVWSVSIVSLFSCAPGLVLMPILLIFRNSLSRPPMDRREWAVAIALIFVLLANLVPHGSFEEYLTPFLPVVYLLVIKWISELVEAAENRRAKEIYCGLFVLVAVLPLLLPQPTHRDRQFVLSRWLLPLYPEFQPNLWRKVSTLKKIVSKALPPDSELMGPANIIAATANRPTPFKMIMGPFSVTADMSADRAEYYRLETFREIESGFEDPKTKVVAFFSTNLAANLIWSVPSFRTPLQANLPRRIANFQNNFHLLYEDENFFLLERNK